MVKNLRLLINNKSPEVKPNDSIKDHWNPQETTQKICFPNQLRCQSQLLLQLMRIDHHVLVVDLVLAVAPEIVVVLVVRATSTSWLLLLLTMSWNSLTASDFQIRTQAVPVVPMSPFASFGHWSLPTISCKACIISSGRSEIWLFVGCSQAIVLVTWCIINGWYGDPSIDVVQFMALQPGLVYSRRGLPL